ncbi:hypothetical protein GF336_03830 [Candidatus Woesearchaeota archaeon]|nr:hypothetical protein [Candidatus Woesearchaeota archaeon]
MKMLRNKINKFKEILKKNFILLWRSKNTVLAIFFGPLLLIFLLGLAFNNTGLNDISIACYSEEYNELSDALLDRLENNGFYVIKSESEAGCIDNIRMGRNHACLIIPSNLKIKESKGITAYVDKSKANLAEDIINLVSKDIEEESSRISLGLTEALLDRLEHISELSTRSSEKIDLLTENNADSKKMLEDTIRDVNRLIIIINDMSARIKEMGSWIKEGRKSEELAEELAELIDESRDILEDAEDKLGEGGWLADIEEIDQLLEEAEDKIEKSDVFDEEFWKDVTSISDDLEDKTGMIKGILEDMAGRLEQADENADDDKKQLELASTGIKETYSKSKDIDIRNATKIVNPLITNIRPVAPEKTHLNSIFPTLLVLIIMFGSVLLSSTNIIIEKKDNAFFRNFISPTNRIIFLVMRFITDFIIILIQLSLFIGVSIAVFSVEFIVNLNTVLILGAVACFFILLGILIGSIFNSEEGSILSSIITTSAMLFFSNTILPVEAMSGFLYKASQYNPFVIAETALRKSMIYGVSFDKVIIEVLLLGAWIFLMIIGILAANKLNIRQTIESMKHIIFLEE